MANYQIPWASTVWPISRRIAVLPHGQGPKMAELLKELHRLRAFYQTVADTMSDRDPIVARMASAGNALRVGFVRRAIGRLAVLGQKSFDDFTLPALTQLHRSLRQNKPPQPYTFDGYMWARVSARRPLGGDMGDTFFSNPQLDHHDLLALSIRPPTAKDLSLGYEEENAGDRKEQRHRWDSAAAALEESFLAYSRGDQARHAQLLKVAVLGREWAPEAAHDFEAAVWMAEIRNRYHPPEDYLASPYFHQISFWFDFIHANLCIEFPDGPPGDLRLWVAAILRSPKARWAGTPLLEKFRAELVGAFDSFGGHHLSIYRPLLLWYVESEQAGTGWIRPLGVLARLCEEAIKNPAVARGAARYASQAMSILAYPCHGLVTSLLYGIYLPEEIDPATAEEKAAWTVQRENAGWGGFSGAEDFSDEDFADPPEGEDFSDDPDPDESEGQPSSLWWYCPQPVHPDSNLVQVPVNDAAQFVDAYGDLGAPLGIIKTGSIRSALLFFASMDPTFRSSVPHEEFGGVKWAKIKRGGMRIIVRAVEGGFVWNAYARKDYHRGAAGSGQN